MRSMTGYGQSAATDGSHRIAVTLRSVNSRYLDLVIKLKEEHKSLESVVRRRVESELHRGRVEATVEIRALVPQSAEVEIQYEVVRALHRASHELSEKGLVARELSVGDLLALPGVVELRVAPDRLDAAGEELLEQQVQAALDRLVAGRESEGAQLRVVLLDRQVELQQIVSELASGLADASRRAEERLRQRLEALLGERSLDPDRLAQEVAILADKSDVTEEIDRLVGHLEAFGVGLEASGPVGRRLDFLTQEMLRELNTLGSKIRDSGLTPRILEAKLLCEQLREQIQNVE